MHQNGNVPSLTSGADFRRLRKEGFVRTLECSGRVVRLRPVNLFRMLQAGKIPDPLTSYVASRIWAADAEEETRSGVEQAIEWQEYLDLVAVASLMHPLIVDNPQADSEISIEDLLYDELMEIYRIARNPLEKVKPFREEQGGDVGIGDKSGEGVKAAE